MTKLISDLRILGNAIRFYFPGLLFVGFAGLAFFHISEARDMMVISAEAAHGPLFLFISVFCWAFITWYTSHIVVYTRCRMHPVRDGFPQLFRWFPRLLAVACYAIPAFAMLSLSYTHMHILMYYGLMMFYIALVVLISALYWNQKSGHKFPRAFWWSALAIVVMTMVLSGTFFVYRFRINILISAACLLVFSIIHLLFMAQHFPRPGEQHKSGPSGRFGLWPLWVELPQWKIPYLQLLNAVSLILAVIYVLGMHYLDVARYLGPFSIPFLAFSLFLGFGNMLSYAGLRMGIRLHYVAILLAVVFGSFTEPHWTRMMHGKEVRFCSRATADQYFDAYFKQRMRGREHPTVVFVLADGGASRSGLWTSAILSQLQETYGPKFRERLFSLSGVSGGAVGVAAFYGLLSEGPATETGFPYRTEAEQFFGEDFLSFTLMRMIGPDLMRYVFARRGTYDRAGYLEMGMESTSVGSIVARQFKRPFSSLTDEFRSRLDSPEILPVLLLNAARVRDGAPAVISNIRVDRFNNRIDLLGLVDTSAQLQGYNDLRLSTATVLCSRFPYISPAGRIHQSYFIDGGYFDNSGAGVTHELMLLFDAYLLEKDPTGHLYDRVNYVVIHMQNAADSKLDQGKMHPIVNDLFAPVVGITRVRTMQTRVNNERLKRYLAQRFDDALYHHWINYSLIENYTASERALLAPKLMEDFSMNWVLSDSIQRRMQHEVDVRFEEHRQQTDRLFSL